MVGGVHALRLYLDTHVVVWLYAPRLDLLSPVARARLDTDELLISPMVILELDCLQETGRIAVRGTPVFEELHLRVGLNLCQLEFSRVVGSASALTWSRDPFDRLIVAQAAVADCDLLTRHPDILENYGRAVW